MPLDSKKKKADPKNSPGRILLISYFFPPTAGGGVFRPLAMVKYLTRLGWDITLITATTPKHYPTDPSLEKQIPGNITIKKIPVVWEGSLIRRALGKLNLDWIPKNLVTPDERVFWADKANTLAGKLIRQENFDLLYTTGPPFSILQCGLMLKRANKKIPWIAEFRDPWTLAPYLSIPNPHHRRIANDTEKELMEKAEAVVMVTPTFGKMMQEKYPASASKVHCIPNGFDTEDFQNIARKPGKNEFFTIVAAGTVFGHYNMDRFLTALETLKNSRPEIYKKLVVHFQGLPDVRLNQRLLDNNMIDRCSSQGFVNHTENIRDIVNADLLILPLAEVLNSEGHIPSRTYEYLASSRPILAIIPDGDLNNLLSDFPQVSRVHPSDSEGTVNALIRHVASRENNEEIPSPDPSRLRMETRKNRALELSSILTGIIENRRQDG
jgi:glycosyltransferase involved in cell wall biosynthesis